VCRQRVGQPVRVAAAMIHKSNPVQPFGEGSFMSEGRSEAVVLEIDDVIHVDHVLRTYGRHYFRRRMLRETLVYGLATVLTIVPLFWWIWRASQGHDDQPLIGWAWIFLSLISFLLVALVFEWLYDSIERRIAPFPDDLSHEERLRRPV
jgi:hypothetical protein